jgi:hypothetical protein
MDAIDLKKFCAMGRIEGSHTLGYLRIAVSK